MLGSSGSPWALDKDDTSCTDWKAHALHTNDVGIHAGETTTHCVGRYGCDVLHDDVFFAFAPRESPKAAQPVLPHCLLECPAA